MGTQTKKADPTESSERVVKKRASQACYHCRSRKVKCDLVKSGVPCHNCKSDGIECVVIESRRSRKFRLQKRQLSGVASLPTLLQARSNSASEPPSPKSENDQDSIQTAGDRHGNQDATGTPTFNQIFQSPPSLHQVNSQNGLSQQNVPASTVSRSSTQRRLRLDLPSYIRPVRPTVRAEDIEFLSRRGALSLPDTELRNQLLRCFVLYVYPYMPIVDLEDILGAIDGKQEAPKISLTLFQAIMFAGTAFVDLQLLLNAGYNDRRSARGDYFQKVKLLYDFDWDVDRIPLIQSLLLGNYWYVSENDQKDPWHWVGICISLATSIGVNQVVTYSRKDSKTCRLWRRLWWTCVLRDRIISASMRRPMRLKDEETNLPPLTLHDFETHIIATDISALRDCPFITDTAVRKNVAQICIANIGICLCIGRIMKSLYQLRVFGGSTAEATMLYKPRTSQINPEQVSILQDDLDHWCKDLPNSCLLLSTVSSNHHNKLTEDVLFLHKAFLQMTYLMAVETLNRPQVLLGTPSTAPASKANSAIEKIAETTQWLQERNLIKFLQPLAVSFMLFSLASFLVDIKTKGKEFQDLPSRQFHTCIRALWQLRETWPIADSASFLVGQMISKSQVGGFSTPVIVPAPISSSDLPAMLRPTEKDLSVKHAMPFQYPNVNHMDESASYPPLDVPTTIPSQPQTDLTRISARAPGQVADPASFDPSSFAWQDFTTGSEIDDPFSSIIQGQALQMDFAFQEFEGLGDFQNSFLGFGPSPNDDFDPQAPDLSHPSSGQVQTSMTADWNQDPTLQSTYIDPSFRSSRQG